MATAFAGGLGRLGVFSKRAEDLALLSGVTGSSSRRGALRMRDIRPLNPALRGAAGADGGGVEGTTGGTWAIGVGGNLKSGLMTSREDELGVPSAGAVRGVPAACTGVCGYCAYWTAGGVVGSIHGVTSSPVGGGRERRVPRNRFRLNFDEVAGEEPE